jgi:hypothetical protein
MAHNHEFDCKQCGAHLDSREALDRHNREEHTAQAGSSRNDSSSSSDSSSRDSSIRGERSGNRDASRDL